METRKVSRPLLDWGVAAQALPGQTVCGDLHLVQPFAEGVLVAAVDGLGHGAEAARAAEVAVATLQAHAHEPVASLLQRCHEALRATRGAVLTVASVHAPGALLTWAGVGTIEAVLLRADGKARPPREEVLLLRGVVGLQLPPVRGAVLPVAPGDTLLLATDGIRSGFADGLRLADSPQQLADHILARDVKGTDDALVLVARYLGRRAMNETLQPDGYAQWHRTRLLAGKRVMSDTVQLLTEEYASALGAYLAAPCEAGLLQAYDLGRRTLTLAEGMAELGGAHGLVLAAALSGVGLPEERRRLTGRAAEFLGEALAPFQMVLRGYREANSELQRLNATLEQRVQERTAALGEASRRKDEFLAMLAHELRNLLAPIRNALQILRLARANGVEVGETRDLMERQVQHLVRLIDDLLDVSRIARGKIRLRTERLDVATVVQSALEISRPHLEAAGHELTVALPPGPLYVRADAARLAQVVANLLNNATKYTEPGGHIWLTVEQHDAQVVVRVRDTGIGIAAEMLPDIFNLFVQVPAALERSQGGLGIGLTLVKSLVELHGGSVEAASAGPRQGSEFRVRLPVAAEEEVRQEPEQHPPVPPPPDRVPALRLLVVDDNRASANSLAVLMKLVGHDVQVAYDGPAALEAVRTFQPQVLIQDLQMPGMSGLEVARRLRAQPATGKVFLVAMTGYGSEEDRRRCLEAGFDHHLVKPVDFESLQQVLGSLGGRA